MSSWGVSAYENDTAADLCAAWDVYVIPNLGESAQNNKKIMDRFLYDIYYRGGIRHEESDVNLELITIGQIYRDHEIKIDERLIALIERAVYEERQPDPLSCWDTPKLRRDWLNKFVKAIGGKLLKKKDLVLEQNHKEEIEELRRFTKHLKVFCGLQNPKEVGDFKFEYEFFDQFKLTINNELESVMLRGIDGGSSSKTDEEWELLQLRTVAATCWIGTVLKLPDEEHYQQCLLAKRNDPPTLSIEIFGDGS
jgi:hypothetical protein